MPLSVSYSSLMLVIEVVIISLMCLQLTSLLFHLFMINVFSGSFPPKMWNLYNKSVDLTNNKAKANKTEVTTVKLEKFASYTMFYYPKCCQYIFLRIFGIHIHLCIRPQMSHIHKIQIFGHFQGWFIKKIKTSLDFASI